MAVNENQKEIIRLSLSPKEEELITERINIIFKADFDEALPLIEKDIQTLNRQEVGNAFEILKYVLETLWNFFKAINLLRIEGNRSGARDLFKLAAEGFEQLGEEKLRDLSIGLLVYTQAAVELESMNIGQALDLFEKVKEYLQNAGKYGSRFDSLIDHMEPDIFFISTVRALLELDYPKAKILSDLAFQSAEQVAQKYYQEGEPDYNTYKGLAHFYKAFYMFSISYSDLLQFNYDAIAADQDIKSDAILAQEFLDKADTENINIRNIGYISKALVLLFEVMNELAILMQTVFRSNFKPDLKALTILKQKVDNASDYVSKAGPLAVTFVRFCDQLSNLIINIERLSKPKKKDFARGPRG